MLASVPGHVDLRPGCAPRHGLTDERSPNWVRLPLWLAQAWAGRRTGRRAGTALAEVLWSQLALFLCVRLQDDLLDGQRDDLRLLFVADRFLLESLEGFQRVHALDGGFWAFYRDCIRDTVEGILEVKRIEKRAGDFTTRHLGLHARASAVLKVGAAAVSRLYGHAGDGPWLSRLQDQLAICGQIHDDLHDLIADLRDGRFTWVANVLLAARPGESHSPPEWARRLDEGLMRPEREAVIVDELRRVARAAAAEVPDSAPEPIHDLVRELSAEPDEIERSMHEARVRRVFGEAMRAGSSGGTRCLQAAGERRIERSCRSPRFRPVRDGAAPRSTSRSPH